MDKLFSLQGLDALVAKSQFKDRIMDMTANINEAFEESAAKARSLLGESMEEFQAGSFENLDSIRLKWIRPDWFEFIPVKEAPFAFVRHTGERIVPGRMYTDGGSIPRPFWVSENLSPWTYGPAFLIHDWEFDVHHCKWSDKRFEEVRDTMMEAIRTLIEMELSPMSEIVFRGIYMGIDSPIARELWNKNPDECPLPPQGEEEVTQSPTMGPPTQEEVEE
ncbi:MAG: hypothetical protein AAFR59_04730 [Bacteroidota bacterium]